MSVDALEELFRRLSSDAQLKARFQADPDTVLSGFDLSEEERQAVRRVHTRLGSASRNMAMGFKPLLDPWISGPELLPR